MGDRLVSGGMKQGMRILAAALLSQAVRADEGMWLFNRPPVGQVEKNYGFKLEAEWVNHLRESSVRFNTGGSGSFVSDQGLILTNHHVGAGIIASLSTAGRNLIHEGFLARKTVDELPCGDLELNVLVSIRDVTTEVQAVVSDELDAEKAMMKRRAVIHRPWPASPRTHSSPTLRRKNCRG